MVEAKETCNHEFGRSHTQWGEVEVRSGERSRPFWHVRKCAKCGATEREADRYYGDDMDVVHFKW
jgi:hypothetical protein